MLSQLEFSILCDIHHFQKAHLQKYLRAQCFPNSSSQFSVTFVTFENVSLKMYIQFYIIDTLMSNSLWHSSLLKNVGYGFTYATNVLRPTPVLKHCGRKYYFFARLKSDELCVEPLLFYLRGHSLFKDSILQSYWLDTQTYSIARSL